MQVFFKKRLQNEKMCGILFKQSKVLRGRSSPGSPVYLLDYPRKFQKIRASIARSAMSVDCLIELSSIVKSHRFILKEYIRDKVNCAGSLKLVLSLLLYIVLSEENQKS